MGWNASFRSVFGLLDWRAWAVIAASLIAIIGTGGVYYLGLWQDPSSHMGAVFAGWVAGVALFVVAGAVVALVSLARPERESFDARARILFRRQTGKHIDYIVGKMHEVLEHYAESNSIRVTLLAYHAQEKKYFVAVADNIVLRSYLDDVDTTWNSGVNYSEIPPPPPQERKNRLVYVRISDVPIGPAQEFDDRIERPISMIVERNKSCKIEYLAEFWSLADTEKNEHEPVRYNQRLTVEFENLTGLETPVTIKISQTGAKDLSLTLNPGELKRGVEMRDVKPGVKAYEYTIMAP